MKYALNLEGDQADHRVIVEKAVDPATEFFGFLRVEIDSPLFD